MFNSSGIFRRRKHHQALGHSMVVGAGFYPILIRDLAGIETFLFSCALTCSTKVGDGCFHIKNMNLPSNQAKCANHLKFPQEGGKPPSPPLVDHKQ